MSAYAMRAVEVMLQSAKIYVLREGLKKVRFGLLAELAPPPHPNLGPIIRLIFYCFIQIYTLKNMKQFYGVLLANLIYSGNYGQN